MKFQRILLIIFLLLSSSKVFAGKEPLTLSSLRKDASGAWMQEKVITISGASKDELYTRVKKWVLTNVKSIDNAAVIDDPSHETIATTPTLIIPDTKNQYAMDQLLNFKLLIEFKEGKMKITMTSFYYSGRVGNTFFKCVLEDVKAQAGRVESVNETIDGSINTLLKSIEDAAAKSSNW